MLQALRWEVECALQGRPLPTPGSHALCRLLTPKQRHTRPLHQWHKAFSSASAAGAAEVAASQAPHAT